MIKKSLIAIALVAFLAGMVKAADVDPYFGPFKYDWKKVPIAWPYEYKTLDICVIPVYMNVGMYVHVKDCDKIKIELVQGNCADIGRIPGVDEDLDDGDFPCYHDCTTFKVRANFEVKLGAKLTKHTILKDTKIYFDDDTVDGDGNENEHEICMAAWKAEIWKETADAAVHVGDITLTVKPNAAI